MEMPENVESNKNLPRIKEYDRDFLMEMISKAKCSRHGVFTVSNFNVRALEETCYDEASRYHHIDSLRVMESQHSVMMSAANISGDVPVREISHPTALKVEGLLLDIKRVAPVLAPRATECLDEMKETNQELNQDQVDKMYNKHVLSKVGKCGRHNVVDINVHAIAEDIFVNAFQPKGKMVSIIIHARCSIWNSQRHVELYLSQECVNELKTRIVSTKYLDSQLKKYLDQGSLWPLNKIFIPVYDAEHFSLVVVNLKRHSFDCLDSLPGISTNAMLTVIRSMRAYLADKFKIVGVDRWSHVNEQVEEQNNDYDCGFRLMLHMIHYGKSTLFEIDEEMVFRYRKRLAVELLYHKANKLKPSLDEPSTSQVPNGLQGTEGSLHSLNGAKDLIHSSATKGKKSGKEPPGAAAKLKMKKSKKMKNSEPPAVEEPPKEPPEASEQPAGQELPKTRMTLQGTGGSLHSMNAAEDSIHSSATNGKKSGKEPPGAAAKLKMKNSKKMKNSEPPAVQEPRRTGRRVERVNYEEMQNGQLSDSDSDSPQPPARRRKYIRKKQK